MWKLRPRAQFWARLQASGWHLIGSFVVASLAAALVFLLWYPGPYRELAGGRRLFQLVVAVDVVLGPALTFAVFDLTKGWPHLRRDLAIIVLVQLAGLIYGVHAVYSARPVAMVYEGKRFSLVTYADVLLEELPKAAPAFRKLPLTGPWTLAIREADPGEERTDALFTALKGFDTSARPGFWLPYEQRRAAAWENAQPLEVLLARIPERRDEMLRLLAAAQLRVGEARYLPVRAYGDWVAVLKPTGEIATYLPFDGF